MGIGETFGVAFYKAEEAAGVKLPLEGNALLTVNDKDKEELLPIAKKIKELGFNIFTTEGTGNFLREKGIENKILKKLQEGRPNISDRIKNKEINLIINTPAGRNSKFDDSYIRMLAIQQKVPYITSMAAAQAGVEGIAAVKNKKCTAKSLQDYHKELAEKYAKI